MMRKNKTIKYVNGEEKTCFSTSIMQNHLKRVNIKLKKKISEKTLEPNWTGLSMNDI